MAAPTGKSPAEFIPNYSSDGTNVTIPIASLPGLTAALAHATTGDVRAFIVSLLDLLKAGADQAPLVLGQSATLSLAPEVQITGLTRKTYTLRVLMSPASYDFADVSSIWG